MEDLYKYLKNVPTINPNVAVSLALADASDDTQDATAVAADIKEGKTAYIATGKVTGTFKGVDTSDATAAAGDLLDGKTAYVNGSKIVGTIASKEAQTYTPSSSEQVINAGQYLAGAQTIAAVPTEEKSATPSTAGQEVVPTTGKFLSKVTVSGDANLVADNIKSGVSIFGVQGTLTSLDTSDANAAAGDIRTGKTAYVNGSKITGTLNPGIDTSDADATAENIDSGKTAYVKGQKITGTSTKVNTSDANAVAGDIATGKTAYVNGVKLTGTHTCPPGLDTSDANATAADILTGKTAYVNGLKVTGSIPSVEAATITPGTLDQTINAGQYVAGAQTIKGEPNLLAENIKNGVSIFGVSGTYQPSGIDTSDATATADQILEGATAYVKGEKVTGTHTCSPTTVTAVHQGKVKDTSNITLQIDYTTAIMRNNFEFDDDYVLAEGDVIMFPDNAWVSAVVTNADVAICNHSSSNTYELKGKTCYVLSKAEAMT